MIFRTFVVLVEQGPTAQEMVAIVICVFLLGFLTGIMAMAMPTRPRSP